MILSLLLVMVVKSKKTVSSSLSNLHEQGIRIGKDVFYRLKNKEQVYWRCILWHIVMKFVQITKSTSQSDESDSLIVWFLTTRLCPKAVRRWRSWVGCGIMSNNSESCKRINELDTNRIEMMLRMFFNAAYRCLRIDYVF